MLQCGGFSFIISNMTKYNKPPLNFIDQAKLLIQRGLIANESELSSFLSKVNYYRFTGYLYPFRQKNSDCFIKGTTFDSIHQIYLFDAKLRLFTFAAIEVIDIAILRTQMVEEFSIQKGPFCYTIHNNYKKGYQLRDHQKIMDRISENVARSREEFVINFQNKYKSEIHLPFWMIAELSTFGLLSKMFKNLPPSIQAPIAKKFKLHSRDLISWLHTLSTIRNICAHHSRLWNRALPVRPSIPIKKYHSEFYSPTIMNNQNYLVILAILKYLLDRIEPDNSLIIDFADLLEQFPEVPIFKMGFPPNWKKYPIFL